MVTFDRVKVAVGRAEGPSTEGEEGEDKTCGGDGCDPAVGPSRVYQRVSPLPLSHWPHFDASGWP